jgi:Fur family ferric uptake transcriptional regulator
MKDPNVTQVGEILHEKGLRRTNIREQILTLFLRQDRALSKSDVETHLGEIDRITLYRTLKAFEEKGIIHQALDGTDNPKYALCPEECGSEEHQHNHAHFHCRNCNDTFCIDDVSLPNFRELKGHRVDQVELVVQGVCEGCQTH